MLSYLPAVGCVQVLSAMLAAAASSLFFMDQWVVAALLGVFAVDGIPRQPVVAVLAPFRVQDPKFMKA